MDRLKARMPRPHERRLLRRMKRQLSNTVNSRHAQIILLSSGGVCNREIAQRVDCTPAWVRRIIHRFNEGGIDAIWWCPYCGVARTGPRRFRADVVEDIAAVALSPPRQLIGLSVWSLAKLRDYLVEQQIVPAISLEWRRQLLRRGHIRWRHTKTWKESDDPEFWPKYRRLRRLYRHRPQNGVRRSVDEFGPLNLQPRHGQHYAALGHVDRLRATYHRTGGVHHFLGVYDLERDTLTGQFVRRKNWPTFLAFLKGVRRRYAPRVWLHIVLDNAGYHWKAEVQAYAAAHRIKFYWTPTEASWLNRIESHFTALKKFTLDNTDYRTHEELQQAIWHYLAWRNRRRALSLQPWHRRHRQRHTTIAA